MSKEQPIILDEGTVKNGNILRVYNKNRKTNAKKYYWFEWVQLPSGEEIPIMLTEREFQIVMERAARNVEDTPTKSWLTDVLD